MGRPHTGHDAVFTGTRQARPTKIVTFPRDKAEKSPFQQHDLSILIVGPNQLKYRLSGTRKPKSHPSSNTQCPITPESRKEPPPQKKDSGHAKAGPDAPTRPTTRRLKHHVCAYSPRRAQERLAAVPVAGGGAWPGFAATRRAKLAAQTARGRAAAHRHTQRPGPTTRPSRRPEHQRHPSTQQQAPHERAQAYKKPTSAIGCRPVVELGGFEPPTFSLRTRRATNCAIAPRTDIP